MEILIFFIKESKFYYFFFKQIIDFYKIFEIFWQKNIKKFYFFEN